MDCKNLMLKGSFVLLLVLTSTMRTLADFVQTSIVAVNETEGFVDLTLLRSGSSGAETFPIRLMTLQEFSERDTSVAGGCRSGLTELGPTPDLSRVDQAQVGSDFSPASVDVVFEDGEVSKTFRINITDDNIAEPLLEIFVALVDKDIANCALPIVISDDDVVRLNFNLREDSETVRRNFSYTNLTIVKTGTHELDITVAISVRSTSATEGVDFVLPERTFVFTSTTNHLGVPIEIFDLESTEAVEAIVVCLPSSFDDARIRVEASTPQCFKLTLFDDDEPVVGYPGHDTEPIVSTIEGDPAVDICVGFIGGNLDDANFIEVSVTFMSSMDGSYDRVALTATQFGVFNPVPTTIQLSAVLFQQICSAATAVENEIVDGHVTFIVTLELAGTSSIFSTILGSTNFTLEIRDDDFNNITLSQSSKRGPVTLREGQGSVRNGEITLNRVGPSTTLSYVVTFRTEPSHSSDFTIDPIVIEPSTSSVPLTLTFVDDVTPEHMEQFVVFIDTISIGNGRLGNIPVGSGRASLNLYDNDVPVGFSETQLTLNEGSMGSLNLRIPHSFLSELETGAQVTVTLVLQRQEGETGEVFMTVEPNGSPIELSTLAPSTSLRLVVSNDDVCTGVKRHTLSFINSSSSSSYTAIADEMGTVTISVTDDDCITTTTSIPSPDGMTDPSVGGTVGGTVGSTERKTVCVPCIVIPILLILLCCLLCLLIIILWLCCCKKRCWHTYDPRAREKKFGNKPLDIDDDLVVKYGKIDNISSPPPTSPV